MTIFSDFCSAVRWCVFWYTSWDKRSEVVSWQVCRATCYRPYGGANPPLNQTCGHLNVEARNDSCMDGFRMLYELWHFNVTGAKLFYISLGIGNSSRRADFQGNALYLLILRLYSLLQRERLLSWKTDGRWTAAVVKMPFSGTVVVRTGSDATGSGCLRSSAGSNG